MKRHACLALCAAMLLCALCGCGNRAGTAELPPAPDNMLDEDQWDKGGKPGGTEPGADPGLAQGGYDLDVEAGTAVLENLKKSFDQDTVV